MSVLSLPRVTFFGSTLWNPATNNNAYGFGYAKDPVTIALPKGETYDTFSDWLITYNATTETTNGDWNVFGQMQAWHDAKVVGTAGAGAGDDPLIGGALVFRNGTPKLVDVDAYSSLTSQVFLGDFGVDAGDGVSVTGPSLSRQYSRRFFGGRNTGAVHIAGSVGVIWQGVIARDAVAWGAAAASSPALAALRKAFDDTGVQGLMIRMASYSTVYFPKVVDGGWQSQPQADVYKALAEKYNANKPIRVGNIAGVFNPAESRLCGAIGLWRTDEMVSVPSGRIMSQQLDKPTLGPAEVQLNKDAGVVSFDFQSTIPETDETGTKADVGTFTAQSRGSDGTVTQIGTISPADYDQRAYEGGGGILDVPFSGDWDTIAAGTIELHSDQSGVAPLVQQALYADTDDRGVYLNEGDTQSMIVQVFEAGKPATSALKLHVATAPSSGGDPDQPAQAVQLSGGTGSDTGMIFDVDASGTAKIGLSPVAPGTELVLFVPYPADQDPPPVPGGPSPTTGYGAVRVLPFDDKLGQTPDDQITWEFVYENVLRPFDLAYHGMSDGVFSLGKQETVRANADAIIGFTDPAQFESPFYMPVTRDLSRGRRDLLVRFLGGSPTAGV